MEDKQFTKKFEDIKQIQEEFGKLQEIKKDLKKTLSSLEHRLGRLTMLLGDLIFAEADKVNIISAANEYLGEMEMWRSGSAGKYTTLPDLEQICEQYGVNTQSVKEYIQSKRDSVIEFEKLLTGQPTPHDDNACQALMAYKEAREKYERIMEENPILNQPFSRLSAPNMQRFADSYDTTIDAMKQHHHCLKQHNK